MGSHFTGPTTTYAEGAHMADTKRCTPAMRAGRLAKARQFHLAAETIETVVDDREIADAYVTLCVHAGIAAADVICCAKLGEHHTGDDHQGAIAVLAKADKTAAKNLTTLLGMKTRAGYSASVTSTTDQKRAARAVTALLRAAESV